MNIRLEKLPYLIATAESKSFLAASYRLNVAQSNVSRVIKELENDIGDKLFFRSVTGAELTAVGNELYQLALKIRDEVEQFSSNLNKFESINEEIKIGTYDSIGRYFFPAFLKYLANAHPQLNLKLKTAKSSVLLEQISSGELEIGVVVRWNKSTDIGFESIFSDHFNMYRKTGTIHPTLLRNLIIYKGWATPSRLNYVKKRLGFKNIIETDNIETTKGMAEQGVGVGVLPSFVALQSSHEGTLTEWDKESFDRNCQAEHFIGIQTSSTINPSKKLLLFKNELSRFLKKWAKTKD
jgi:DNA-binding transcriptional LysR family regulator